MNIKLVIRSFVLIVLMAGGILYLYHTKQMAVAGESAKRMAEMKAGPFVKIAKATMGFGEKEISFVGEAIPFQTVTLYAKTSGYIEKMLVDKGDVVKEGQTIAELLTPEIDQQYKAAVADLENKKSILQRNQALLKKDYISVEEAQISETDVRIAEATLKSLQEQQAYKYIKAPFNGTITARFADQGALVQNAMNSQTSALPIASIGELDKVRIYIYVEQKDAAFIQPGYPVTVCTPEHAQSPIKATVTRRAGQLDQHTHMMTTEIDLDNTSNLIVPGGFVTVKVPLPGVAKLTIPSEALVVRGTAYFVPLVDDSSKVKFKEIKIAENTGQRITVLSGIKEGDRVALNIGERLNENQKVRIDQ